MVCTSSSEPEHDQHLIIISDTARAWYSAGSNSTPAFTKVSTFIYKARLKITLFVCPDEWHIKKWKLTIKPFINRGHWRFAHQCSLPLPISVISIPLPSILQGLQPGSWNCLHVLFKLLENTRILSIPFLESSGSYWWFDHLPQPSHIWLPGPTVQCQQAIISAPVA